MKKALCMIAAFTAAALVHAVEAPSVTPYASLGGGFSGITSSSVNWAGDGGKLKYDPGYVVEGAVGAAYRGGDIPSPRAELAVSYQENDADTISQGGVMANAGDLSLSAWAVMVNGYLDLNEYSPVTIYLLAGLGFTRAELEEPGHSKSDTLFTGQVGVGAGYAVAENVIIDLKYRLVVPQGMEFSDEDGRNTVHFKSQQVLLGVRVPF